MFQWIDKGCICNLEQMMKIWDGNVVLKNGTKLPINEDRVPTLKARLREYLIQKEMIKMNLPIKNEIFLIGKFFWSKSGR